MAATNVPDASASVIAALTAAGRSRTTIKRHAAEFNAFAGFLGARGRALPAEADCLDFIAERSGSRLAGLREPASSQAGSARTPAVDPVDGRPGWRRPGGGAGDNAAG
jgi:integrase/recombinase XerD